MRLRNVPLSGMTYDEEKSKFEVLASENDLTVSEAIHLLVVRANKTGKIPK